MKITTVEIELVTATEATSIFRGVEYVTQVQGPKRTRNATGEIIGPAALEDLRDMLRQRGLNHDATGLARGTPDAHEVWKDN